MDETALVELLQAHTIAGAGLDTFVTEPLPKDSPLCKLDNVILTPHVAFYSQESARDGRLQCCADIRNYFTGNYDKCVFVPGGNNVQK